MPAKTSKDCEVESIQMNRVASTLEDISSMAIRSGDKGSRGSDAGKCNLDIWHSVYNSSSSTNRHQLLPFLAFGHWTCYPPFYLTYCKMILAMLLLKLSSAHLVSVFWGLCPLTTPHHPSPQECTLSGRVEGTVYVESIGTF